MTAQPIPRNYNEQLDRIYAAIIEMGGQVNRIMGLARSSFAMHTAQVFDEAKSLDVEVNKLEDEIEALSVRILSTHHPMGADFRTAAYALKICGYLENMGDLAKKIVLKTMRANIDAPQEALEEFDRMSHLIIEMNETLFDAFHNRDAEKIKGVYALDDKVDGMYYSLLHYFETKMQQNPDLLPSYMQLLLAAKSFERLGDYTSRICRAFYYIITGKRLKTS